MKLLCMLAIVLLVATVSGCGAFYVQESFLHEMRTPVEPPVAATDKPDKPDAWWMPVVQGVGNLIGMEWIVQVVREGKLIVTDTTETVANAVRDVKTQTHYERVRWKRSALLPKDDSMFKNLDEAAVKDLKGLKINEDDEVEKTIEKD